MADTGPYDIGDDVFLILTFRDRNGNLADPDAVVCKVRKPDQSLVNPNPTATRQSLGVWEAKVSVDQAGDWWYRGEGTGAIKAAGEKMFNVRTQRV